MSRTALRSTVLALALLGGAIPGFAPAGLVANWKLNESAGTLLLDSAGGHSATLRPGAALLTDIHPV